MARSSAAVGGAARTNVVARRPQLPWRQIKQRLQEVSTELNERIAFMRKRDAVKWPRGLLSFDGRSPSRADEGVLDEIMRSLQWLRGQVAGASHRSLTVERRNRITGLLDSCYSLAGKNYWLAIQKHLGTIVNELL